MRLRLKPLFIPGAAALVWLRVLSDDQKEQIRSTVRDRVPRTVGPVTIGTPETERRKPFAIFGIGAALGALLVYFFDPERGRSRRVKARDMSVARVRRAARGARKMRVRAENKAEGVRAGLRPDGEGADLNDPTLEHKIESEVLRDFPKGKINVNVEHGRAVLRGELDQPEQIKALEAAVGAVPGVREVENLTHLRGTDGRPR